MEQHSAVSLISEFLGSADPQVRRNALTALASIRGQDSLREVVRAAVSDADDRVRDRAQEEILALGSPPPPALTDALHEELQSGRNRLAAYALVGRLRSRGMRIGLPPMSLAARARLALALRRQKAGALPN